MPSAYSPRKHPFLMFFTGDWLKDPALAMCEPATRGIWVDLLCAMHELDRCGEITGTYEKLARVARCSVNDLRVAIEELKNTGTAGVEESNGQVTVINRRMQRDFNANKSNALRQSALRKSSKSNGQNNGDSNALNNESVMIYDICTGSSDQERGVGEGAIATGAVEVPDFEQAFAQTMTVGIPREFCQIIYDQWVAREGKDGAGVLVKWFPYVKSRWTREQAQWKSGNHPAQGKAKASGGTVPIGMQIKALEEEISKHPANFDSVFHRRDVTDLEKADLRAKREKLKSLKAQSTN